MLCQGGTLQNSAMPLPLHVEACPVCAAMYLGMAWLLSLWSPRLPIRPWLALTQQYTRYAGLSCVNALPYLQEPEMLHRKPRMHIRLE